MASALTEFEHGFSTHGGRMLDRRTVLVECKIQLHKQTWVTCLHALPTANMLINLQYLLNAQPVYLFSRFSYLHVPNGSQPQSYHATNNQTAKNFIISTIVTIYSIHKNNTRMILS